MIFLYKQFLKCALVLLYKSFNFFKINYQLIYTLNDLSIIHIFYRSKISKKYLINLSGV